MMKIAPSEINPAVPRHEFFKLEDAAWTHLGEEKAASAPAWTPITRKRVELQVPNGQLFQVTMVVMVAHPHDEHESETDRRQRGVRIAKTHQHLTVENKRGYHALTERQKSALRHRISQLYERLDKHAGKVDKELASAEKMTVPE